MTELSGQDATVGDTPRVFVISLRSAEKRRETFARNAEGAADAGVAWTFFDACQSLSPSLSYRERDALIHHGRPLHPRELACYSSHYSVWEQVAAMEGASALILEDDAVIDWRYVRAVLDTDLAGQGIHYLKLYITRPVPFRILRENFLLGRSLIRFTGFAYGAVAYVLTPEGARRFVETFRDVKMPVDDLMDRDWYHGLTNLALYPSPVFESVGPSTIGDARHGPEKPTLPPDIALRRLGVRIRQKLLRGISRLRLHG
jgi:glycosyl transferase family 25